jgi:hypothetical protein
MESRVAVLEQIARTTAASLERIERRLDAMEGRFAGSTLSIPSIEPISVGCSA